MKRHIVLTPRVRVLAGILGAIGLLAGRPGQAATVALPESAALPVSSASNPGFVVRSAQASDSVVVANGGVRALKQIDGTLTDPAGNLVTNIALPGPDPGGVFYTPWVNFEKDAAAFDVTTDYGATTVWTFANPDLFPGTPGQEGTTTKFSIEAVGLVQLSAGTHTLGVSVSAERTDYIDDDGFSLYVGAKPRDYFATKVMDYDRGRAAPAPFVNNQHVENLVTVTAPTAGIYPFRILYWQTAYGANLQFYEVNTATGERHLFNDALHDPASTPAFRDSTVAEYNAPYIAEIWPVPGSAGNSAAAPIQVILSDGSGATVSPSGVQLFLNNMLVTPQTATKTGTMTTVVFNPDVGRSDPNNTVKLIYTDSKSISYTNQWSFTIITAGGSATTVTGQWDFNYGDLRATIGKPLTYFDPTFDGPTGSSPNKTQFGTCSQLGVPLLNGVDAKVMKVPGDLDRRIGYVMDHGIAPNGGGTKVNQYTLIMDLFVDTVGTGGSTAASLLQIDSVDNTSDGDLFWQANNFGQSTLGYVGRGTFTTGAWHRIVAAYDEGANPPVVTKYCDGIKQDDWTANQGLDNPRRALLPTAILFADGDQDERRMMWVKSIQIRSGKLSDAEMYALGGPQATGIPVDIPQSTVTGQWDFEFGDLGASIGTPLAYFDPTFDGPTGSSENKTQFGLCSELGVDLINGVDARVMKVPGDLTRQIGYVMTHRIAPNGGGTKVNQYTLIMDVWVDTSGPGAASLLQIDSTDNTSDGDLFWQGGNFGQGSNGYNGTGIWTAGSWHRMAAAYNEAATPPVVTKYVDGIFQDDWTANQGLDNPRRALLPTAVLFADGDQDERRIMWVKGVQIRAGALSKAELAALGAPTGQPIPLIIEVEVGPEIKISVSGNQLTLTWPASVTGYTLESATAIPSATWDPVPSANNSATVTIGAGNKFFRLKK